MDTITVLCKECNKKSKVEFQQDLCGKKITFRCKKCKAPITMKFPESMGRNDITFVTTNNSRILSGASILIMGSQKGNEELFDLKEGEQIIGRKSAKKFPEIPIETKDSSVSRLHCVISGFRNSKGELEYTIRDNKSKNGVLLNGLKLSEYDEVYLKSNDEIYLGQMKVKFTYN